MLLLENANFNVFCPFNFYENADIALYKYKIYAVSHYLQISLKRILNIFKILNFKF